jgi:uncharacterized protein (TIGR00304 family)
VEDEKLNASSLLLAGFFTIFIGFLLIMIGIVLGIFQNSEPKQDYSRGQESFGIEAYSGNTSDSSKFPYEKPPEGKVEAKIKGGGVIMLGPIPIIFGSDKESAKTAAILAIILMLLSLLILRSSLF